MSEPKFTPGPWTFSYEFGDEQFSLKSENEEVLGGCGCCGSPWVEEVNAHLIAAAPELYEALDHTAQLLEALGGTALMAKAALAKARGENHE